MSDGTIDSAFTHWCVTCPDSNCDGFYRPFVHGLDDCSCSTCHGRDLHPMPMSELYDMKHLFDFYSANVREE